MSGPQLSAEQRELLLRHRNGPDPVTPDERSALLRDQLTAALKLDGSGIEVVGAEKHGQGIGALCAIHLSNGETIEVDHFHDLLQMRRLTAAVIESTGTPVSFKQADCPKVAALVVKLADWHETATANDLARDWGLGFLAAAEVIEVELDDQAGRWAAFCLLDRLDPLGAARREAKSIAACSTVLRDAAAIRYVHSGWFLAYVRREAQPIGAGELLNRMSRIGWERRGGRGRIKATNPSRPEAIWLPLYLVAEGWEDE
jgi:hypothetical protein